jgi:hypothetical protein
MKNFQKGELVLLWRKAKEKISMHTIEVLWIRPYVIEKIMGFNSYILQDMKVKRLMLPINRKHVKCFFS